MPKIRVVLRDGEKIEIDGRPGASIMEHIRDLGIDELAAICGGYCACGTCHVYVFPEHLSTAAPMSDDECDLLDSFRHRRPNSRLACQIEFDDSLDGLIVVIAPED